MLATIREYLRVVKPRTVLWFYYEGNDLEELIEEKNHPLLTGYVVGAVDQGLFERQAEIDQRLATYVNAEMEKGELSRKFEEISAAIVTPETLWRVPTRMLTLGQVRTALGLTADRPRGKPNTPLGDREPVYTEQVKTLFPRVLSRAKAEVNEWGGELYFVYLPAWSGNSEDQGKVRALVSSLDIPIIDVLQAFQAHSDPASLFPFRRAGHYNEAGNRLVATVVLRHLNRSQGAN
jgi:hypothetical protein